MKVGDYVRTNKGNIAKIVKITDLTIICDYIIYPSNYGFNKQLRKESLKRLGVKSSPNIIDLIEVGDVLVVKDFVDEACMIFTDIYLIQNEQQLINIKSDLEKNKNKKLYSIVTSEQFSQMEYRIGG